MDRRLGRLRPAASGVPGGSCSCRVSVCGRTLSEPPNRARGNSRLGRQTSCRKNSAFYVSTKPGHRRLAARPPGFREVPDISTQARVAGPGGKFSMGVRHALQAERNPGPSDRRTSRARCDHPDQRHRRCKSTQLTPREAARLQGLPDWFDFGDQPDAATYSNSATVSLSGAAQHVFRTHVLNDLDVPPIREAVADGTVPAGPVHRPDQQRTA